MCLAFLFSVWQLGTRFAKPFSNFAVSKNYRQSADRDNLPSEKKLDAMK